MKKIYCVVSGFPNSYSELGKISLILIRNLIELKSDEWDIEVICNYDEALLGYMEDEDPIKDLIVREVTIQPDIWIQIGEPHTFANYGKIMSIGVCTAPMTDVISKISIDGMNRMDVILTTSEYSKKIIESTKIEHRESSGRIVATDKIMRPVEVINFGVNEKLYSFKETVPTFAHILDTFCFIVVGNWDQFDTDSIAMSIYSFINTFKGKGKKPALILKTACEVPSQIDKLSLTKRIYDMREKIGDIDQQPSIYIINDTVSDEDMRKLYETQRVKAMFSLSRSVRTGIDLQEFSLTGKPIIAPNEGSHRQYLIPENTVLIPGKFIQTNKAQHNELIVPNSGQYVVDFYNFQEKLKHMYENYSSYKPTKNKLISKSITLDSIKSVLDKYIRPVNNVQYTPEEETFEL